MVRENTITSVAAGIFNSGFLASSDPSGERRYNYGPAPDGAVERARRIARVCEQHGTSLPAAAIAFPLAHPAVVSVCIGARSAAQVERNVDLYEAGVPPALWLALLEQGLLREDAPV